MTTEPTTTTPSPAPGQTPMQGDQTPGQTPTTPQGQTPQGQPQQPNPLTEHWTERDREYIQKLRKEAEDANEQLKAFMRKQQAEEDARKKKQGEYQLLAEQYEEQVKKLEPEIARLTKLTELVSGQIESQVKDWPAEVKAFDPGTEAPIEARLAWVEKSKPLVAKIAQQTQAAQPGNKPNPTPAGASSSASQDRTELYRRYNAQRGNII